VVSGARRRHSIGDEAAPNLDGAKPRPQCCPVWTSPETAGRMCSQTDFSSL